MDIGARVVALEREKAIQSSNASISSTAAASTAAGPISARGGGSSSYGNPYAATSPTLHSDPNGIAGEYLKPPKKRRITRLGGFPPNTSAELIIPVLDEIRLRHIGIVGAYPSGQITNKALIFYKDNACAWTLIRALNGD